MDFRGVEAIHISREEIHNKDTPNEFHTRDISLIDKDGKELKITVYTLMGFNTELKASISVSEPEVRSLERRR